MVLKKNRIIALMAIILSVLSLFASLKGVFDKDLYYEVYQSGTIPENLIWGSQAQDIISIPFAVLLAIASVVFIKKGSINSYISIMGLTWYFFYAFGLYTLQGQYTSIYGIYLAIFGLSFYTMVFGLIGIDPCEASKFQVPEKLRKAIMIFLSSMLLFMYPVWIIGMSANIKSRIPGATYAVYILDLGLIFPAIAIICYLLFKRNALGVILSGIALLKTFSLCLSWAFSEVSNLFVGNQFVPEMALISSSLTLIGLALFIPYIIKLERTQ